MTDLRPAELEDAPKMATLFRAGFESFRDWAPAGWSPPEDLDGPAEFEQALRRPDVWARVVGDGSDLDAYVAIRPATVTRGGDDMIPGLGHLWMLFVRRECWGRGLARLLLGAAVEEMRRRGFEEARLFTPAGNRRSRELYERAGWRAVASAIEPAAGGLRVTEYRLIL